MTHYSQFLKNKNFILYNIGQMLSQFSDRLIQMAVIGVVYKLFHGSPTQLAKMLFCTVLPAFFVSPIAGVYIDRWNKKHVLVITNLVMGGVVCCIPFFLLKHISVIPLYAAILIIFSAACFFLPAKLSIMPDLVAYDTLLMANSMSSVLWMTAGVLGFTLGAFLMESCGIEKGLYLNAFFYVMTAIVLFFIKGKPSLNGKKGPASGPGVNQVVKVFLSFGSELRDGFVYMVTHRKARFVGGMFCFAASVMGALYVVMVVFVQELTGSMTKGLGIFGIFLGAGFLLGAYVFGKFGSKARKGTTVFYSFILGGLSIVVFLGAINAGMPAIWENIILFVFGLVTAPIAAIGTTLIHESIDEGMRGRVFSSIGILMNAGFVVCMFLSSHLAEHIDKSWIIFGCGIAVSCLGVAGLIVDKMRFIRRGKLTSV